MIDEKKLIKDIKNNRFIVNGIRNGKTCFDNVLKEYIKMIIEIIENQPDVENKKIDKEKKDLLENTNIETNKDEMKVLDSFLFRCWQMGWLNKYK